MATFGRYTLVRRVASGGMAEIWKAKVLGPAGFQKTVAIKRVLPNLAEDPEFIAMFIEEAKLAAELVHPNIVQVFDFGQVGPTEYYIAMEYVPGCNAGRLQKRAVEKGGRIPPGVALYIAAESAKGLHAAHSKSDSMGAPLNVVHRDISPQNLLVSFSGDVKVGDFGIAKAASASSRTAEGQVRGKLSYMSPEQSRGKPLDGRSDLFSLGLVLYELLTSHKLLGASTTQETFARVASFVSLTPDEIERIAPPFRPVVLKALHPEPSGRFQTGQEMDRALTAILGTEGLGRARDALSSIVVNLFDDEKKLEQTQPNVAVGTELPTLAGVIAPVAEPGMAAVGGINREAQTTAQPGTPASGLTLQSGRISVTGGSAASAVPPPRRASMFVMAALGASVISLALTGFIALKLLHGGPNPPATPVATATVAVAQTATATPIPAATATAVANPTRALAASPRSTPRSTQTAVAIAQPTATLSAISHGGAATLDVTSRPWVQVWVDGKMVKSETPLQNFRLSAGSHKVRFVNAGLEFDQTRSIEANPDAQLSVSIDVRKGTIDIR